MADSNKVVNASDPADNSTSVGTAAQFRKAQAAYRGNNHGDLVEIEIVKDGDFYKKGDKDLVHPTVALILKEKGLISNEGKEYKRPEYKQQDVTVDA